MPACFQLTRKSNPEAGPEVFTKIDDELCAHFGVEPHETNYFYDWYNIIGLKLAMGSSFDNIIGYCTGASVYCVQEDRNFWQKLAEIAEYLNEHFTTNAWHERKQ